MCRICEKRVCNRHMVMAVARINIYVSQGFPVALTHPQGETRTSVAGGAYLEGFERGPARCLGCRERDGRQSLAASRDLSGLSLGAALAEISTHTTAEESRKAALHREYDDALRQLDELTAQAVSDFLGAAGRIEPRDIENGTREHTINKKGRFGITSSETVVEQITFKAHIIYSHKIGFRNYDSEEVYVLPDGRVLLRQMGFDTLAGYKRKGNQKLNEGDHESIGEELFLGPRRSFITWRRGNPRPGLVPFQIQSMVVPAQPDLAPGLPDRVIFAQNAVTWFVKTLAEYLASHAPKA